MMKINGEDEEASQGVFSSHVSIMTEQIEY